MQVPASLIPLLDLGVIEEVIRPVMSGKEAEVFLVISNGERCIAKVYKDAQNRSFKQRSQYIEGRKTRNTRDQRARARRTKHGRAEEEQAWRSTEADMLDRLGRAGVAVPRLYAFVEGVLVMELVAGPDGTPAPRLVEADLTPGEAQDLFHRLLREIQRMLCAGVVHGDLSDFNILLTEDGPVIIDLPQAVDPAHNRNARSLLIRDVRNLTSFLSRYIPDLRKTHYGEEMWVLYERGELHPDTRLTGRRPKRESGNIDVDALADEIAAAFKEEQRRRESLGLPPRKPVRHYPRTSAPAPEPAPEKKRRRRRRKGASSDASSAPAPAPKPKPKPQPKPQQQSTQNSAAPKKRRRRRRRRSGTGNDPKTS